MDKIDTYISLFSGAMGLDLGLQRQGFWCQATVEIDEVVRCTIRENFPGVPILDDITKYTPEQILKAASLDIGEATLITGGPPCQSFSTAGSRRSTSDPRGSLFRNFASVVDYARPRFFVMENVRGLLSSKTPGGKLGSAFQEIIRTFEDCGYQVVHGLVMASDYGVPQDRQRVIIIGSRDEELGDTTLESLLPEKTPRKTLRDAIWHMMDDEHTYTSFNVDLRKLMECVPAGENWRHFRDSAAFTDEFLEEIMGGAYWSTGGRVGFFRRLSWDKPSPTLVTSPLQKATLLCHPSETRPLSIQEYAAIQQFPPEYKFCGSVTNVYKQIGNAVPVGLGSAIGAGLRRIIDA